ncbi:MAG: hypothetical protein KDI51_01480 [Xanthomonadales bacterium]|nr:hypothetical protein [Xanthomonadales bacterium]
MDISGDFVVAGCVYDGLGYHFLAVKYAPDGRVLWTTQRHAVFPLTSTRKVAVDGSGDYLVTGSVSTGANSRDVVTMKLDGETGAQIWAQRFTGAGPTAVPLDLLPDSQGDVLVSGYYLDADGLSHMLVQKLDGATGAQLWLGQPESGDGHVRRASSLAVDAAGDVLAGGSLSKETGTFLTLLKLDGQTGTTKAQSTLNRAGTSATSVAMGNSGDVYVAGIWTGSDPNHEYLLIRYDGTTGNEIWVTSELGPDLGSYPTVLPKLVLDDADNPVLTGSIGPGIDYDVLIQKHAADTGSQVWSQRLGGVAADRDMGLQVATGADGDVYVLGSVTDADGEVEFLTARLAGASGGIHWQTRFDRPDFEGDAPYGMVLTTAGDVITVGSSYTYVRRDDFAVVKLNGADGSQDWVTTEGPLELVTTFGCGEMVRSGRAMATDAAGNSYVTGCSYNGLKSDVVTAKFAADGRLLWQSVLEDGLGDSAVAMALDGAGDVVVTGDTKPASGGSVDVITLKYAGESGALQWSALYTGPNGSGSQHAEGVTVDPNGDVIISGRTSTGPGSGGPSPMAVKYAGGSGEVLWASVDDAHLGSAHAVATDAAGDVFVVGALGDIQASDDQLSVTKLSGATGSQIWLALSDELLGVFGVAEDLAIDDAGDVIVAGSSYRPQTDGAIVTAKLDGGDGSLHWAAYSDGPGPYLESAHALALDAIGDVIVTGVRRAAIDDLDFVTAKYTGLSGQLQWERIQTGEGTSFDAGNDVVVMPSGDVVVTGRLTSDCDIWQNTTIKYSGTTGETLWVSRDMPSTLRGSGLGLAGDGSLRVAGTVHLTNGDQIGVVRIDEMGVADRVLSDGFENATAIPLDCPAANALRVH